MKPCYKYGNPSRECPDKPSEDCHYLSLGGDWKTCANGGVAVDKAVCAGAIRGFRFRVAELEAEKISDRQRENDLRNAVNAACICGGMGPCDPGVCPACMVWHYLQN